MQYRVTWEIDIEAETPREAAEKARDYQTRNGTTAVVFTAYDEGGEPFVIDLLEDEEERHTMTDHTDDQLTEVHPIPIGPPVFNPLEDMTWDRWSKMPEREREALRDMSGLTPQLTGLEGWRVEVADQYGETRRFIVGRSTGWRPCHIEVNNRRSSGGQPADREYKDVRRLYYAR